LPFLMAHRRKVIRQKGCINPTRLRWSPIDQQFKTIKDLDTIFM
jgi:hypothetical protein